MITRKLKTSISFTAFTVVQVVEEAGSTVNALEDMTKIVDLYVLHTHTANFDKIIIYDRALKKKFYRTFYNTILIYGGYEFKFDSTPILLCNNNQR